MKDIRIGDSLGQTIINGVAVDNDGKTVLGFITQEGVVSPLPPYAAIQLPQQWLDPIGRVLQTPSGKITGKIVNLVCRADRVLAYEIVRAVRLGNKVVRATENAFRFEKAQKDVVSELLQPDKIKSHKHKPDTVFGVPSRIIADYAFLLGRVVTEDLTRNGVTIIKKGEIIVTATVATARKNYLLFDLTVKSRS